jgi:hypothetical protein
LINCLPPKRLHLLTSRSGKLQLELQARGKEHIILIQEEPDGQTELSGQLNLKLLKEPEQVSHVKIRLKGIVRTLVMKSHASGRHPISDELTFLESSTTLYSSNSFLPSNESTDPNKLFGNFEFPFKLCVPARITHYTPTTLPGGQTQPIPLSRPIRPPPSFMLSSQNSSPLERKSSIISTQSPPLIVGTSHTGSSIGGDNQSVNGAAAMTGSGGGSFGEVSCRYFIKVTLGRKGLLKFNERWIIPVVFVPRQITPSISRLRELHLTTREEEEGGRIPHSDVDPEGWNESGKYLMKRSIKKPSSSNTSFFRSSSSSSGVAEILIEGKTIRGQKIERGDAGTPGGQSLLGIPFEVEVSTSRLDITGKLKPKNINVFLVQRTSITAQKLTNAQDVVVSRATSMHPFGISGGDPEGEPFNNGIGWKVKFGGNIKLPPHLGVSFRAPNLSVTYVLCFSIK